MKHLLGATLALLLLGPLHAEWLGNLEAAKEKAAKEDKDIYLVFTALKFSGACVQLEKRILSQEDFQKGAEERFVLLRLDVPLQHDPGKVDLLAPNRLVAKQFGVESYPTAFYLDSKGRSYARQTGVLKGGPVEYVKHLNTQADQHRARAAALKAAYEMEGLDRAKAIIEVLKNVAGENSPELFEAEMAELARLDPDDSLDFQKKALAEQGFRDLERSLKDVFHKNSYGEVVKLVDAYVKEFQPEGTLLQKALFPKLAALNHGDKVPEAIAAAEKIIAVDAGSSHGKFAAQIRKRLKSR